MEPEVTPAPPVESSEPETLGDLIQSVVGEARKAWQDEFAEARKGWAKDLADLLDIGADDSNNNDPGNPPTTDPTPVVEPVSTGIRGKKVQWL